MDSVDESAIGAFLTKLSERVPGPSQVMLLGGSALIMLGMRRPTIDIDYLGDDLAPGPLEVLIDRVAAEMHIHVDPVPIERFVPIPDGASSRHVFLGRFGSIEVWAFDPYTIALSKLDRGFDSDLDDIAFLVRQGHVELTLLGARLEVALERAVEFDIDPASARRNLQTVRERLAYP